MKKYSIIISSLLLILILTAGCKKYLDVNINPNATSNPPIAGLLANVTSLTANNSFDIADWVSYYTQYLASPSEASSGDTYDQRDPSGTWGDIYNVLTDCYDMRKFAEAQEEFAKERNTKLFNVVTVSGAKFNPAGHDLLNIGGEGGWYFQVHKVYDYPTAYYTEQEYEAYLMAEGKHEISRTPIDVPNPAGAIDKLHDLLGQKWLWLVIPHNCVNFVETVVQAGGSTAGSYSNLPKFETFR